MKATELIRYLDATVDKWGDIDCMLDFDSESEYLYNISSVFCDINPMDNTDASLVFATYETKAALSIVK
jgi:hypothetical protein